MVDTTLHALSAVFAIVAATSAGVLAVLAWRALRRSPFGAAFALLSVTLSGVIAYHVALVVFASESLLLDAFGSVLHTAIAGFLWLAVAAREGLRDDVAGAP